MKQKELMEKALQAVSPATPAQLARELKVTTARVADLQAERRPINNTEAKRAADVIGIPWPEVIAEIEIERAKDEQTATAWGKALASLRRSAAVLVLAVLASLAALQVPDTSAALRALLRRLTTIIFIMSISPELYRRP